MNFKPRRMKFIFKNIKPKFSSKLIYFNKIRKLESYKPLWSKRIQRDYLENELNKLNICFGENTEFYNIINYPLDTFNDYKAVINAAEMPMINAN